MKICIIDDHPVVLNGTKAILQAQFEVMTLERPTEAVAALRQADVALALIDVQMPALNGLALCDVLAEAYPDMKRVLYTGYELRDYYGELLSGRVHNVVSKSASREELVRAIEATLAEQLLVPLDFLQMVRHGAMQQEQGLAEKERAILRAVAGGMTNKAIALELGMSQRTVEHHLTKIFDKLHVSSRAEAVLVARERKLM